MQGLGIGVHAVGADARAVLGMIGKLEAAGVETAWMTTAAQAPDPLVIFGAAALQTERIRFGTSIVQTYPRHPLALAQEAIAVDQLAPGRLRLGVGPSGPRVIEPIFGIPYEKPTTHLREYVTILRKVLQDGEVDFEGEMLKARVKLARPTQVEVLASALRAKSFELAGELTDGAISWMCARDYIATTAAPALRKGAKDAGRDRPPLIGHVPLVVSTNDEAVHQVVPTQFGFYLKVMMYQNMFRDAGYPEAAEGEFSQRLLENLVIWGDEAAVRDRLAELPEFYGFDEILVSIVNLGDQDPGSFDRTIEVLGNLAKEA